MDAPPAWTLLFTGLITGIAVGVFGCFLLYLSGHVPPLQGQAAVVALAPQTMPAEVAVETSQPEPEPEPEPVAEEETPGQVALDFYQELQDYVVEVDATPIPIEAKPEVQEEPATVDPVAAPRVVTTPPPDTPSSGRLLQIGAFQQASSAETQLGIVKALGVDAFITQYARTGRTLHAVQAGPFSSTAELNEIRALLQRNDIDSFFVDRR